MKPIWNHLGLPLDEHPYPFGINPKLVVAHLRAVADGIESGGVVETFSLTTNHSQDDYAKTIISLHYVAKLVDQK